jgi:hypothetical protein
MVLFEATLTLFFKHINSQKAVTVFGGWGEIEFTWRGAGLVFLKTVPVYSDHRTDG